MFAGEQIVKNAIIALIALAVLGCGSYESTDPVVAVTHRVIPTGDVTRDGRNIQAAIDAASPGDTILLGSGKFVLGEYLAEDTAWVSTSRGSFRWFADFARRDVRSPAINPLYWSQGGGPATLPFPRAIVVDKPLTLEGEDPPGSTTITTVNNWSDYPFVDTLYSDANFFLVASSGVTIRNLKFYNMQFGMTVISAGTIIEDIVFDTPGHYSLRYFLDEYAAYPNLPSRMNPVKSYVRRNKWLNAIQAIHMYGSEIEVTDNVFEIRNSDSTQIPYSLWAIIFGGLPDFVQIPGVFTWSECRNNIVQNNIVEGDENSRYGAFYFAGYGVAITKNTIINNTIKNMWALVESHGRVPVERNNFVGNEVTGGSLRDGVSFGVHLKADKVAPRDNLFSDNKFVDVSFPVAIFGGQSNLLIGNDYASAAVPGWANGGGSIFLAPGTEGNFIREQNFPKDTAMCDQILDLGSNTIPGGDVCENNPVLAPSR